MAELVETATALQGSNSEIAEAQAAVDAAEANLAQVTAEAQAALDAANAELFQAEAEQAGNTDAIERLARWILVVIGAEEAEVAETGGADDAGADTQVAAEGSEEVSEDGGDMGDMVSDVQEEPAPAEVVDEAAQDGTEVEAAEVEEVAVETETEDEEEAADEVDEPVTVG